MGWLIDKIKEIFTTDWISLAINNLMMNWVKSFVGSIAIGVLSFLNVAYNGLLGIIEFVLKEDAVVQTVSSYVMFLCLLLLVVQAGKTLLMSYIVGENDAAQLKMFLLRVIMSITGIIYAKKLLLIVFEFVLKINNDIGLLMVGHNIESMFSKPGEEWLDAFEGVFAIVNGSFILASLFAFLFVLIALLIAVFQVGIRGAEIALLAILAPFFAIDIVKPSRSLFGLWAQHAITTCLTMSIQLLMLNITVQYMFESVWVMGGANYFIMAMGWAIVTVKTPNFLKQFIQPTGVGGMLTSAGQAVAGAVM